jgi:hypothetical protein
MMDVAKKRKEVLEAALPELERPELTTFRYKVELTIEDVMALVAFVQLALRHPKAAAMASAVRARKLLEPMIAAVEARSPKVGELLRMGDQPEMDV